MPYPGPKVHRPNRRKLGRGQFPSATGVTVVVTDSGDVATLTFSRPVVVTGQIPMTVTGGPTFVSQAVVSPTVVTQTYNAALTTHPYTIPGGAANVMTYQGGQVSGISGTFP
jgi:hypothetical protein